MENGERGRRLLALLEPCRASAMGTARRLSRSNADGDELFHDAVFHAYRGQEKFEVNGSFGARLAVEQ